MKKLRLFIGLLVAVLLVPTVVLAADEEVTSTDDSKKAIVYFFRGEGCSHCAEAEEWFNSIQDEYGELFKVVDYEVWENEDNAALMEEVAKARDESADGVPYIIVGDKSWNGFAEDYAEEIIDQIKALYEQDPSERYDILAYVDSSKGTAGSNIGKSGSTGTTDKDDNGGSDALALLVILLVAGGIGFGVYKAREKAK